MCFIGFHGFLGPTGATGSFDHKKNISEEILFLAIMENGDMCKQCDF
jgi:hypothetical protein